jgi:hypothetical protein
MTARLDEARVRDILRALCRIKIPRGQLVLYRLAVEEPVAGFTSGRVRELLKIDQAQHRGLMAALTVRINNTPRETTPETRPGLRLMFRQDWVGSSYRYTPLPELIEAIRRLPALAAVMSRPIDEVVSAEPLAVELPADVPEAPPAPAQPSDAPSPAPSGGAPFVGLLDALERADLVYSSELVANLLLALQVKRFVILTGVSGTWKTRIAQVLADRFAVSRRVDVPVDPGDQAAIVTVMPYMRKHHRFVLPQVLAAQLKSFPTNSASRLHPAPRASRRVGSLRRIP